MTNMVRVPSDGNMQYHRATSTTCSASGLKGSHTPAETTWKQPMSKVNKLGAGAESLGGLQPQGDIALKSGFRAHTRTLQGPASTPTRNQAAHPASCLAGRAGPRGSGVARGGSLSAQTEVVGAPSAGRRLTPQARLIRIGLPCRGQRTLPERQTQVSERPRLQRQRTEPRNTCHEEAKHEAGRSIYTSL